MKRIYIHILAVVVAALALAGCQNEDFDPSGDSVSPSFSASIEGGQSRAIGCAWESGDKIGITHGGTGSNLPKNKCYVTPDGDGKFIPDSPEDQIYYMSSTQTGSVTFCAYYPWRSTTGTIIIDASDQSNQHTIDILTANATGTKASPEVEFVFQHKMSKVTFVFKSGNEDVSNIDRLSLGDLKLSCQLTITSNGIQTAGSKAAVTMDVSELKDGEPAPSIILIPQTGLDPLNLKIHCRNGLTPETTLTFPDNTLVSGTHYKWTITVNKAELTVSECTIEGWTDYKWPEGGGGGEGTADSADDPEETEN